MSLKIPSCCFLLAVALFTNNTQAATTTLTGFIFFKGKAPKKETIRMNSDPACLKQNGNNPVYKEDVQVNTNGTLAGVIVYLKQGVKPTVGDLTPVILDQAGCHYNPHVLAVQVNQPIKIINSDPTMHNVHSLAKTNQNFNVGMAGKGDAIEKKFSKPELPVRVKCDVHGWMNAFVGVFDHPYFAVTDSTGGFMIKNVPPGEYTIETWQEKLGSKSEKVKLVEIGGTKKIEFTYQ
jgi:hypothetical protein